LHENADRTRNEADNSSTFLMTNMMPQVPELNRGVWSDLEEYCRELVQQGKELYIVAGPMGKNGSIGKKEKLQCRLKIGKLLWCWIGRDWGFRELQQRPGRSP
jgi:endonuclease G